MRWWVTLGVLAGCGAEVQGGGSANKPVDAGPSDVAVAPDTAAPDALPCTGGDAHKMAPDGSCLVLFTGPHNWVEAQASCSTINAHLAILHDAAMDTAAEQLVGALDAYIGLTDQVTEGTFVWVDGTPAVFTNWRTGEPSDGDGMYPEDCVVIAGARTSGGWDDRPCAAIPDIGGADYAALCQR